MVRAGAAETALLAGLVVLAGCGGSGDAVQQGGTLTPVPVPGDEPSPTAAPPPGVAPAGVENPSALVTAHRDVLRGASYTVCRFERVTVADGTFLRERSTAVRIGPDRSRFHVVHAERGGWPTAPPTRIELWSDGDTLLVAREPGSPAARYETHPAAVFDQRPAPFDDRAFEFVELSSLPTIRTFLAAAETRIARETGDGEPGFRVTGSADRMDGGALPGTPAGAAGRGNDSAIRNVSLDARVTPEGFVSEFRVRYDAVAPGAADATEGGTADGVPLRVTRTVRYADVGATTIDRPRWYRAATNGTGAGPRASPAESGAGPAACGRAG